MILFLLIACVGVEVVGDCDEVVIPDSIFSTPVVSSECGERILFDFNARGSMWRSWDDEHMSGTAGTLIGGGLYLMHEHPEVYSEVVDSFSWVSVGRHGDHAARYIPMGNGMRIVEDDSVNYLMSAALLYHESIHAGGARHVDCGDGRRDCDEDWSGPYGQMMFVFDREYGTADEYAYVESVWEWAGGYVLE